MATYFKINDVDFSTYVNSLDISSKANYTAQVNAAGDSVVDYVNSKRVIKVGIIPLTLDKMRPFITELEKFSVSVSYKSPKTGYIVTINCIVPTFTPEYYTIQDDLVMFKEFTLSFTEL